MQTDLTLISFALLMTALPARGEPLSITIESAIAASARDNPGLLSAILESRKAEQAVLAEEGLYPFMWSATGGVTRSTTPTLDMAGGVSTTTTDSVDLTTGFSKSFSTGTKVSLDLTGSLGRTSTDEGTSGPGYGISGRLTVAQPLVRGFGKTIGEYSLRHARYQRTAAQIQATEKASSLVSEILTAYWELWYATQNIEITTNARELSRSQLEDVQARIEKGTLAPVEALSFETTLATREEALVQTIDTHRRQSLELARLIGMTGPSAGELRVTDQQPVTIGNFIDSTDVAERARTVSYTVRNLETAIEIARDSAKIAGEDLKPRVDVEGWVMGQGLGNDAILPAFEQMATAGAGAAFVGLTFDMPMDNRRRNAQVSQARLAIDIAKANLDEALLDVAAKAESLTSQFYASTKRLDLAQKTVSITDELVKSQRRKFEIGTAIALQVRQAEDDYMQARLRKARAQVDAVEADIEIEHLTGRLLARWPNMDFESVSRASRQISGR